MPATFKVVGTFALRSRKQLVVFGEIVEGDIARGMELSLQGGKDTTHVDSIEYVDFRSLKAHYPALVLHSNEAPELDAWCERLREGVVVSLK